MCSAEGSGSHYPISEAGVWVDCIRRRAPVIHNDYEALPHRQGLPPGHAPVVRELVVPVMRGERIVAVLGVGNKPVEYGDKDVEMVSLLADFSWEVVERKRVEEALEVSAEELARSNRDLEQFAYAVSHDLQEPLRMVSGFLSLLEQRCGDDLDDKGREFIGYAVDGAERMQAMIQGLLDLSRVTTRGRELAPVDCEIVLAQTLRDLQLAIEDSGATVTHDPLPKVWADGVQLGQVLQNLVGNALKFRSEAPPRVHISAERQDDRWQFCVRDNGLGVDPARAERIFGVFERLHTRDQYPGLGLGLAISKRIIERHGGRIWVEPQAGSGSAFCFTIPNLLKKVG
jgi:light-regulated signal transduction histidine kinase (bacteriophytochrome)